MTIVYDQELKNYVRDVYTREQVDTLRAYLTNVGTFEYAPYTSGLYPATPNVESEGGRYSYVWVRDNVYIAHALWRVGRIDDATAVVGAFMRYFAVHAKRFDVVDSTDPMCRPHVRFDGETLSEVPETWPHAQNDAHGLFLWLTGHLVQEGILTLEPTLLGVVTRTIQFLTAIRFYEDADSGAWEEGRALRASSVGTVCAGLAAWYDLLHEYDHTRFHGVFELYQKGMSTLSTMLPFEVHDKEQPRAYDAALLFLVEPLGLLEGDVARDIVERIRSRLMRERGIVRYESDAFWGPEYDRLSPALRTSDASTDASFREQYAVTGKEAQWTLFDPLLAGYFLRRKKANENQKAEDAVLFATHINRTLGALVRTHEGKLLLPELYYHKGDQLVPNTILPLYWAQANLEWVLTLAGSPVARWGAHFSA